MSAYYNEIDSYCAEWLRNLIREGHIAPGDVDERDIREVQPSDLKGYTQCHFFAGIAGWSLALKLAGWPDERPVWTGSCPCQPFSAAGHRKAFEDERDLWPAWFPLIEELRPPNVFGEQVASPDGLSWLDRTCLDLEQAGYEVAAADLCAASVGAHHVRQRLWWHSSNSQCCGWEGGRRLVEGPWSPEQFERLVFAALQSAVPAGKRGRLSDGVFDRVPKLRALGNAIVPQVAAQFIKACT